MPENRTIQPHEWLIRVDEQEYVAGDLETVKQWIAEGRVPKTALLYHASFAKWMTVAEVMRHSQGQGAAAPTARPRPLRTSTSRKLLYAFVLAPVALIGGCFVFTLMFGTVSAVQQAALKRKLPDEFKRAEEDLRAKNYAAASSKYEAIESSLADTSLKTEKARAKAGLGTALALRGAPNPARDAFKEALMLSDSVEPLTSDGVVMAAFSAGRDAAAMQKEADAERHKQDQESAALGSPPRDFEVKSAVKSYAEKNFNDPDVEVIDVYTPHAEGATWVVRVRLRAKNAFGAKIVKSVSVHMQDKDVVAISE
jgi:hypothetical protein